MFDFLNPENIGKDYKNFILLSIDTLTDYKTKALYLRHKTTGLEVYHILAEDKENTFAFGFRTFAKDSKGCAHIMEHSTLCGSEKYPLKEPFSTLAGQSLNTFLNAMTYPDKTVYPAASVVKSDYFTMMDVYADAVFFPKLAYETFIQEGHRLEMDEKGKLSIQGVVYNEMKGNYSSFMDIAIDFFQLVCRKIGKAFGEIKTTTLMQELYTWYKDNKKWDTAIDILKQNLEIEPKDTWARKEITDCYRGKYAKHSQLEEYIKSSNLTATYRNVFEAISDFEKHIAFDKGSFVFHRNWGVGQIQSLEKDSLVINFGKVVGKRPMSLKMAVTALKPLSKDHIWTIKATTSNRAKLKEKVKENKAWALETIIRSFDNNCDFKRIKMELVPSILSASEWTTWNTAAKKILETDATFGVNPNDINMYTVRDHKISAEEKLSNEFKAQKLFFARIDILMKFFYSDETDKSNELFTEMYSYFTGYLKNISKVNEQVIASYLVVQRLAKTNRQFAFPIKETFAELYGRLENPKETYELLKDTKNTSLKADFIESIKMLPDWVTQYLVLFPIVLDKKLIDELLDKGQIEEVQKFVRNCFEAFKDYRETVLFLFKECKNDQWFIDAGVSEEKQLITLINIIEVTFREIRNHVNSTENKKINKNATLLLFKDDTLYNFMFASNDIEVVKKFYTLIDDIADIEQTYKTNTRNKILEKYPDFKFRVVEGSVSTQPKGMLVTDKKLREKRAEAERIEKVDIPANAIAVSEAREKGDLKENQEYKSAREQQHFLNLSLSKLQEEINRATVFDPTTITTSVVSFATVVTLHNNLTNEDETYTILGPWESDPDNNIISYMSPLGNELMDSKVDDNLKFVINEHEKDYTVKEIKKAVI